jgi:ABC-type multidrug transport system fused ATPase/permease subunit
MNTLLIIIIVLIKNNMSHYHLFLFVIFMNFFSAKSPVFGMVTSSLNGISTIRSAGAEQRLIEEFDHHQVFILD